MDRESFEDIVSNKYEGKGVKAPDAVWQGIEQAMDAELLIIHQARSRRYRIIAIAAMLLAFLSFAFLLVERLPKTYTADRGSFNALRGDVPEISPIYTPSFSLRSSGPAVVFVSSTSEKEISIFTDNKSIMNETEEPVYSLEQKGLLKSRRPGVVLAEQKDVEIYRYRMVSRTAKAEQKLAAADKRVWAGVEAGAGGFNGNLTSSEALAGSLNSASIASSAGISNFVNPTNTVNQGSSVGTARSIGFDLGMEIGKRWTLESGFSLNSMQNSANAAINVLDVYTIDASQFKDVPSGPRGMEEGSVSVARSSQVEVQETFDTEVQVDSRVQFASLPIKAGYFLLKKRVSLRLNAGIAANYLLEGNIADPSNQVFSSANSALYNDWSFDGLSGLEFGLALFNNFDFTIEPNYRYAIIPITESNTAPSRFMVQTGLRYRIQ